MSEPKLLSAKELERALSFRVLSFRATEAIRAHIAALEGVQRQQSDLIRLLDADRDAAYARGLERAAKIAEEHLFSATPNDARSVEWEMACGTIAAAIRSELTRHQLPDGEAKPAAEAE